MKNILLVIRWPVGGIKTYFRYIYSQNCFENYKFTIICHDREFVAFMKEHLDITRARFIICDNLNSSIIRSIISETKNPYDLVHSHGFTAGLLTSVSLFFKFRQRHLMTAHDVFTKRQFEGLKGSLKKRVMQYWFRRIDVIHTVTLDAEKNLLEYMPALNSNKIKNITHGIDTDYFRKGRKRDLHKEIDLSESVRLIGFFGRFMAQKNFRSLVRAVDQMVNQYGITDILVCTHGWAGFIREDYEYIDSLGLAKFFHQLPNTDDMAASIRSFDVVAMPSRWEACGLLAMEVLCCGIPLVGTCVGLREVIAGTPTKIVEPGDSQGLAQALIQVLKNPDSIEFSNFQDEACRRFSITKPAEGMAALYNEMIDSHA